jgi:hypothetical protein
MSGQSDFDIILSRLEKVEKENRLLKRVGLLLLLTVATVILTGLSRGSRRVEAEEFVLKDPVGRVRAIWGVRGERARLTFYDEKGNAEIQAKSRRAPEVFRAAVQAALPAVLPPPPAPSLKLIAYVEKPGSGQEVVVSDGPELYVVHEGEEFASRFRILKIDPTSVQILDRYTNGAAELRFSPASEQ